MHTDNAVAAETQQAGSEQASLVKKKKKTAFGLSYLSTLASVASCLSVASSQD